MKNWSFTIFVVLSLVLFACERSKVRPMFVDTPFYRHEMVCGRERTVTRIAADDCTQWQVGNRCFRCQVRKDGVLSTPLSEDACDSFATMTRELGFWALPQDERAIVLEEYGDMMLLIGAMHFQVANPLAFVHVSDEPVTPVCMGETMVNTNRFPPPLM